VPRDAAACPNLLGTVFSWNDLVRRKDRVARVTVRTLANALGVSVSTVSNAYNRPDQLSAALRARILSKADELGYAGPDAAARALRSGRAEAVGVLLTEQLSYAFSDPYAIGFLTGLSEVVEQHHISIVLMPLSLHGDELDVTAVRHANIDALTTLGLAENHPAIMVAKARGIRLVTADASADPASSWVAIDDAAGGRLIGEHLRSLGHRHVAVVVDTNRPAGSAVTELSEDRIAFLDYASRLRGIRDVLGAGVSLVSGGHNAIASGRSAGSWLLAMQDRPTAIVGLSDVLALGVLEAACDVGLQVPGEISVCGFDDIPAAEPAGLTTVRQPIRERGRRVGELLIDPDASERQVLLPIELIARSSTGPALGQARGG
jgi:DNA-binding LacI/PurR family transcriptional regulator